MKSKTSLILAVGIFALVPINSFASLTFDLRVNSVTAGTGSPIAKVNDKSVTQARVGDIVSFDVFAFVPDTNSNTADDQFQFAHYNLITGGASNIRGNLGSSFNPSGQAMSGLTSVGPFDNASQGGAFNVDLNADGRMDIGDTNLSLAAGWIKPRASALQPGGSWLIGTFKLMITEVADINSFDPMFVNLNVPSATTLQGSNWSVYRDNGSPKTAATGIFLVNTAPSIIAAIPEPSVAVTLLGGVATLLGFRRRKH